MLPTIDLRSDKNRKSSRAYIQFSCRVSKKFARCTSRKHGRTKQEKFNQHVQKRTQYQYMYMYNDVI